VEKAVLLTIAGVLLIGSAYSPAIQKNTPGTLPEIPTPTPAPACSPMPDPLSERQLNNPPPEMTAEDELNSALGGFDWDCDSVCNIKDNCIFVFNPDQKDRDSDGKGDACQPGVIDPAFKDSRCDQDRDGIPDFRDNCPLACNPDQKDNNKNAIGDACDAAFLNAVFTLRICSRPKKVKAPKPLRSPM
jgi:thrombospondin type 3 repeat protein